MPDTPLDYVLFLCSVFCLRYMFLFMFLLIYYYIYLPLLPMPQRSHDSWAGEPLFGRTLRETIFQYITFQTTIAHDAVEYSSAGRSAAWLIHFCTSVALKFYWLFEPDIIFSMTDDATRDMAQKLFFCVEPGCGYSAAQSNNLKRYILAPFAEELLRVILLHCLLMHSHILGTLWCTRKCYHLYVTSPDAVMRLLKKSISRSTHSSTRESGHSNVMNLYATILPLKAAT
jgi:hypothetical protein